MRLLLVALAALASAADAATTISGPANPFSTTPGSQPSTGALSTGTLSTGRSHLFASTSSRAPVQTTISIFTVGPVDPYMPSLVASIISVDPTATVLYLTCQLPTNLDLLDLCGLGPGLTVTQLGTTAMIDVLTDGGAFSWSESCAIATSPVVCVDSAGGSEANFNGVLTTTLLPSESTWIAVDVTAGAELLSSASAKATGTGKTGATTTGGAASATGKSDATGRGWVGLSAAGVAVGAFVAGIAVL
jgi:hypothetical protein